MRGASRVLVERWSNQEWRRTTLACDDDGVGVVRSRPVVQIRLLGGVTVEDDDGRTIDVGPEKCQALLAALALSPGAAVSVSRLVDLVWGSTPPRTAEKTLQTYVGRLRRALGHAAISRVGVAYRLEVDPAAIDVARFEEQLAAGEVDQALAEWTGTPLAGLGSDGLMPAVDGLVERWLGAVETDLVQRIDRDAAATITTLTELTAAHPYREGLWELLMTALYREGRQAEALTSYQSVRQRLDQDLGIEPGPRLQALQSAILSQEPQLGTSSAPGTMRSPRERPAGQLPHHPGRLIGRQHDVGAAVSALAHSPVVTLVGPGGIGKTRLALAAAEVAGPAEESWWVDLADVASPGDVTRAIAESLAVRDLAGRTTKQAIVMAVQSRGGLVVLDNCEHVIDAAAELVQTIVQGCPEARVLTTSREALGVAGEHVISVDPLDPKDAAALFLARAKAVVGEVDYSADHDAVLAICQRLDGIPLAIELAAARTRIFSVAELLDRLEDQLGLLSSGRRTAAARHRTLSDTIAWSHNQLTGAEKRLLHRLSVFTGPFNRHAARRVAADPVLSPFELDDLIEGLVVRSMLTSASGPTSRRFRLLEPIRQYAAACLEAEGHAHQVAVRHSRWCAEEVGRIHLLLAGQEEVEGVRQLEALWPNLRTAVRRTCRDGDYHAGFALVRPVVGEILCRSAHEVGDWIEDLLAITPPEEEGLRILGLAWAAQRYVSLQYPAGFDALLAREGTPDHVLVHHARAFVADDYEALIDLGPAAVAEWRRRGEGLLAELTEPDLGAALLNLGRFAEHDAHVGPLSHRYRDEGPPTLHNWTLMLLGYSASFQGDAARAERIFAEALEVKVPPRTHSPTKTIEARVAFRRGDRQVAYTILRNHVVELQETDNVQGISIAAVEFVNMLVAIDRLRDAATALAYLKTTGLLEADGFRMLVAEAWRKLAAAGYDQTSTVAAADRDRAALAHMRAVLEDLLDKS